MEKIKYSSEIEIDNVPVKWLPKIELFYPDLPGFPIVYVHTIIDNTRIYGFPVTMKAQKYKNNGTCNVIFLFYSNINLNASENSKFREIVRTELKNRIGR